MHVREITGRQRKALAMSAVLRAKGVDADTAEAMSDGGWTALARLAGQREASPITRRCVVHVLRHDEMPSVEEIAEWKGSANASH